MENRCCEQCKYWQRVRPEANWGFCQQTDFEFAGKLAYIYTHAVDFVKQPQIQIRLQTRDVHYCSMFERSVLLKVEPHAKHAISSTPLSHPRIIEVDPLVPFGRAELLRAQHNEARDLKPLEWSVDQNKRGAK